MEPISLSLLALAAASAGSLHTLLGPDHYVPLVALARARGWSTVRAMGWTVGFGVAHCGVTAIAVVALGEVFAGSVDLLGNLAAALLVGGGIALAVAALRARRGAPEGVAGGAGRSVARGAGWTGLFLAALAIGPCEWLVPAALGARAELGAAALWVTVAAYTAATVLTMLGTVALGLAATGMPGRPRVAGVAGGLAIAASGLAVFAGL